MLKATKSRIWVVAVAMMLLGAACGGDTDSEPAVGVTEDSGSPAADGAGSDDELYVVVTTTILGDLVKGLVGDAGTVEVLLPVGADPHDFQMSSQDGAKLREADLVVANGLGLEESLSAIFDSARQDGARVFEVGDQVDPLEWGEGRGEDHEEEGDHGEDGGEEEEGDHDEEEGSDHDEDESEEEEGDHGEEGHHGGAFDPHFWFDPSRVEKAVRAIAGELINVGPGLSSAEWNERADSLIALIRQAATEAEEILSAVPAADRILVTNHDSFLYFGEYFGFEILDTILSGGSTLAQPGTAHLAELVDAIAREGVPAIFAETTADTRLPRTVAAEFDPPLEVVELYTGSLGPAGTEADTYPKWLVSNARLIAEALTG